MDTSELDDASIARVRSEVVQSMRSDRVAMRRSRRRRIGIVSGAGALALAMTGGAIAVLQASPTEIDGTIRCFAAMDGDADYTTVVEAQAEGEVIDTAFSQHALDVCAAMYRAGIVVDGTVVAPAVPSKVDYPVPDLVACTLRDGVVGVFPDENTTTGTPCGYLGFTPAP